MKCETKLKVSQIPEGDYLAPGSALDFETGSWRSEKPVWNSKTCIHCMFCWISCPDSAILVKDGKMTGIDYTYCKGCGICSKECPTKPNKSITMEQEKK